MTERNGRPPRPPNATAAPDRTALVSHEIRGPLGVMMTLSEMLLERGLDDADRRLVELIRLAGHHVLTVAEDLVAEASLGADRLRIVEAPYSPAELVRSVAALWAPVAADRGRSVEIDVSDAPETAIADVGRLRQILFNLISNAMKFAPTGRIAITVRTGETPDRVVFEVTDEGTGLPEGFRLEPFTASRDPAGPGAGIGLWISARIAEAIAARLDLLPRPEGGTLARLDMPATPARDDATPPSRPGRGRRVTPTPRKPRRRKGDSPGGADAPSSLTADAAPQALEPGPIADLTANEPEQPPADPIPARTTPATPLAGLKVLVVDDSSVSRMLMTAVLTSFDMVVTTAASGSEAVPLALTAVPDLVLLDWSLAGESGADVLARLRQAGDEPMPPVLVVSASERIPVGNGVTGHLHKPFTPRDLYQAIAATLSGARAVESAG